MQSDFDCTPSCQSRACARRLFSAVEGAESFDQLKQIVHTACANSARLRDQAARTLLDVAVSVGALEILAELLSNFKDIQNKEKENQKHMLRKFRDVIYSVSKSA